ncbi:MAG: EthD domain-containing protein [Burkholderiales bacterium]
MDTGKPIILFPLYRWAGTTPEHFREHYVKVHSAIGKRMGVLWYETFFNSNPAREWPVFGAPTPDAFTVMMFPSAAALANVRNTPVWQEEVLKDCIGFVSHAPVAEVDRYTWIPEPATPSAANAPVVFFPIYRWAGSSVAAFREHYIKVHSKIGKRLPGVIWYESFLNKHATDVWPVFDAPQPDAFALMKFASQDAMADLRNSAEWSEAAEDDIGFVSHAHVIQTERVTWLADPVARSAFNP